MISFVDGTIESTGMDFVVVNIGGVGLQVSVSTRTVASLGNTGARVTLHTCLFIRDEVPVLFGFASAGERAMFLDLISVSGVGPRVGLLLLGAFDPAELAAAIVRGDTGLIAHVPGVGKKTAARLCVELASKMERFAGIGSTGGTMDGGDVVEALVALGYSPREASRAARESSPSPDAPLEERLRHALRVLSER
ncbi:MAG: Holliday junction branch migration protein RuvA [Chloroflexota bacterium]